MQTTIKRLRQISIITFSLALCLRVPCAWAADSADGKTLNVLFIGNSFTGRHNLSQIVKTMAEAGQPGLKFEVTTVLYGGRTLKDHWRLGTQNFVKLASLTRDEELATIQSLRAATKDPKDKYAAGALKRHEELAKTLDRPHRKWDIVVLQSYRDDMPDDPRYVEYAPKFAELIRAQGGRVVLYETSPQTQNEKALTAPPDAAPVIAKEKIIAAMAKRIGATVVPMAMVALHCQTTRPDFTLRFVNDAHLNQTMAYLTACTFYGALFDRSSEGLPLDKVTDTRSSDKQRDQDRDGGPITRVFSAKDRADLQRIAWEGLKKFRALAEEGQ
ncbi:MAG: hypothetical protein NTY01_21280 [Verrucomicrobia bacterium]|nr:hypothetical protein [Verrucomicrobiota bacterium]